MKFSCYLFHGTVPGNWNILLMVSKVIGCSGQGDELVL